MKSTTASTFLHNQKNAKRYDRSLTWVNRFIILATFIFWPFTFSGAESKEMTPFLTAQTLKMNMNSSDSAKKLSAISYVGGIADYLMAKKKICPPPGSTVVRAAALVQQDLNRDANKYYYLSAAVPAEYALTMGWPCK